jgi:glucan 1,3-beta-glucosidase
MGREQPGTVLDPKLGPQPPFGTGFSSPDKGLCPVDKSWPHDDDMMKRLARAKLAAFELGNGWIFWNFRTELEPKWSYLESVKRGWIPNLRNTTEDADLIMQQWTGDVCKKSWIKSG